LVRSNAPAVAKDISRKSTLLNEVAVAPVIVLFVLVPRVFEVISNLFMPELPVIVFPFKSKPRSVKVRVQVFTAAKARLSCKTTRLVAAPVVIAILVSSFVLVVSWITAVVEVGFKVSVPVQVIVPSILQTLVEAVAPLTFIAKVPDKVPA
jgi:hypothetical protein